MFSKKFWSTFFIFFFILDFLMIGLHLWLGQDYNLVNIDLEKNLPTLYQVFKLFTISSVIAGIIALFHTKNLLSTKLKWLLFPYWFSFAYIGLDELGEIHESFGEAIQYSEGWLAKYGELWTSIGFSSAWWLAFFAPILLIGLVYLYYFIKWLYKENTHLIHWLIFGISCYALVFGIEFWNTSNAASGYTFDQKNLLVTIEEGLELVGATFFLIFNVKLYQFYFSLKSKTKPSKTKTLAKK